tara:strand:+ start:1 stop:714 length:714 start_codon:yes stop_codon:yes gene_type:complete
MKYLEVDFKIKKLSTGGKEIVINGPCEIKSKNIEVPCDPSSASFFIVGALITPNSKITLKDVMLNPTRTAFINILKKMGGRIKIKKRNDLCGENIGDISAEYSNLKGIKIPSSLSPLLIDEYPILSVAASQAKGKTVMQGLDELRHKESNRIESIYYNLNKIGFKVYKDKDDLSVLGGSVKKINKELLIKSFNDHRIAMSFSILNIKYNNQFIIDNKDCIGISYPKFLKHLNVLLQK